MAPKILAFILTLTINAAAGTFIFIVMLLVMNGYHESDAAYGLIAYLIGAVSVAIMAGAGAAIAIPRITKRGLSTTIALLISVILFSIGGVVVELGCSLAGVGIAELVRVNH